VYLFGGSSNIGTALGGDVALSPGSGPGGIGSISLGSSTPSLGGGKLVVFVQNCQTAPTSSPVGGVILYAQGGALYVKGSSGTVTQIAPP
jgi:hypothetical protein